MAFLIVTLVAVVVVLGMILFAVHKTRPRSFRFTASLMRWFSLSLEIKGPHDGS